MEGESNGSSTPSTATLHEVQYRYPGSPPFRDTETDRRLFLGRDVEVDAVLHSILSFDLFLLYAESGLGKTSLLNAGVASRLRERGLWPVSVRLNEPSRGPVEQIVEQIVTAAADDGDIELVEARDLVDGAEDTSLWGALSALEVWRGNELQRMVVVLDQFEEVFTLGWDGETQRQFFAEFGDVVRGHRDASSRSPMPAPDAKFVVVIREDSLGELDALSADVPHIMLHRVRLAPLGPEQAGVAIRVPATIDDAGIDSDPFEFSDEAVDEIIEFLRTQTVRGSIVRSADVDPSQLQIVCQYVERVIVPTKSVADGEPVRIEREDLGGRAGLERILGEFYRRTIGRFDEDRRGALRELCERGLINDSERRLSRELHEIEAVHKVDRAELEALVDARLLRAEPRVGSVYFELAHDTLVAPILADRAERRRAARTRRRRRLSVAGVVAGLVVLAAALVLTISGGSSIEKLTVGKVVDAPIGEKAPFVEYEITAQSDVVLVVEASPADVDDDAGQLDLGIEVTDASGTTRRQDRNGAGGTEQMVIAPSGTSDARRMVRITAGGAEGETDDTSRFVLSVSEQQAELLDIGANPPPANIGPDDVVVYEVPAERGIVQFLPNPADAGEGLDLTVELIGQGAGEGGAAVDIGGVGTAEWIVDAAPGVTFLAVRSQAGDGDFSASHFAIDGRLTSDDLLTDQTVEDDAIDHYVADSTDLGQAAVVVTTERGVGPHVEIFSIGSADSLRVNPVSALPYVAFSALPARTPTSIVRVENASPSVDANDGDGAEPFEGEFDLSLVAVEPLQVDAEPVSGSTVGVFSVGAESSGSAPVLQVVARAAAQESVAMSIVDGSGVSVGSASSLGSSSDVIAIPIPRRPSEATFVGVRSEGFDVEVRGPDEVPIADDRFELSVGRAGLFTIELPEDTYRTVRVGEDDALGTWSATIYWEGTDAATSVESVPATPLGAATTLGCEGGGRYTIDLRLVGSSAESTELVIEQTAADGCESSIEFRTYNLIARQGVPDDIAVCITRALLESEGADTLEESGFLELQPEGLALARRAAIEDCEVPATIADDFIAVIRLATEG